MGAQQMEQERDPAARALKLADMVDYQEGSIVSRAVIDKKTGTVTLFAFDEGQGLSEHTTPFEALVYIVDGEAEITISGKSLHLREGETIVMPAHEPHAVRTKGRLKMLLTMIR
jgi:quercetin dioxygenase-like cupin family protein